MQTLFKYLVWLVVSLTCLLFATITISEFLVESAVDAPYDEKISDYAGMLANEIELRRGVLLSFLSSLLQGLVAILLVGGAYLVLRGTTVSMTDATHALETASYALIAAFGAWLLYRKLWRRSRRSATDHDHPLRAPAGHSHDHGHHHHHGHGHSHAAGEVCATCEQTVVHIDAATRRSRPFPEAVRAAAEAALREG